VRPEIETKLQVAPLRHPLVYCFSLTHLLIHSARQTPTNPMSPNPPSETSSTTGRNMALLAAFLGWLFDGFEMGLFPNVLDDARTKGIDISPKHIPAEVFDKRAVDKGQVVFHDVAAIELKPHIKKNSIAIELTDFSVFYSQDSVAGAEATLKDKSNKIVVEKGQIVKVSKDKDGIVTREQLTKVWTDWIDYWAVDFNFENKREIIRVKNEVSGEWEEIWTGDYIFENEWQSFRTKSDRSLELISVAHECPNGTRKVAVKVVDIFGNDTMTIVEVTIGGRK
jgi:hypothetical protein